MKNKKYNFITADQILEGSKKQHSVCNFFPKQSMLSFSMKNQDIDDYRNRFVKLYVDPAKNTLAWRFVQRGDATDAGSGICRVSEMIHKGKVIAVKLYVPKKMSSQLKIDPSRKYSGMPIFAYTEEGLLPGEKYRCVTIAPNKEN